MTIVRMRLAPWRSATSAVQAAYVPRRVTAPVASALRRSRAPARFFEAFGGVYGVTQATIYVEERAESELAFGEQSLERKTIPKVMEVGISCDPQERVVEICAKGGRKLRDQYVKSFTKHFAPQSDAPVEMPRRDVQLRTLRKEQEFHIEPADGID